ncbi:activating transcription factor 2, partial [Dioszegia hungarica]
IVRPPIRPIPGLRSKFDLEPNPFEQSFRESHHSDSLDDVNDSSGLTPPRGGDATAIKHNALPPLSSLTSPAAADPSQFPWLANQSLRTGPLSPAMLAGPAGAGARAAKGADGDHGAFDQTGFRTGFTPGTGSGFTPGYTSLMGGAGFSNLPMPSPNTAAFLNMVTNSTPIEGEATDPAAPSAIPAHMQQHHGLSHINQGDIGQDTITPNTLSALTGVVNDMNRQGSQSTFYPPHNTQNGAPNGNTGGPPPPGYPHVDYAQQSANAASQAANGLFLLSQAHQELSKREEEGRPPGAPAPPSQQQQGQGQQGQGTKRKSDAADAGAGAAAAPKGKKGKKNAGAGAGAGAASSPGKDKKRSASAAAVAKGDEHDGISKITGKPETEEEKRKNFLERNRQAALKCRQRKKQWLNELQTKVEQLQMENDRLNQTVTGLHDEIGRLNSVLIQHRDCGLGLPTGYGRGPIR